MQVQGASPPYLKPDFRHTHAHAQYTLHKQQTTTINCNVVSMFDLAVVVSTTVHASHSHPPLCMHAAVVNGLSVWLHIIDVLLQPFFSVLTQMVNKQGIHAGTVCWFCLLYILYRIFHIDVACRPLPPRPAAMTRPDSACRLA